MQIDESVKNEAIRLRRTKKLKLPDAIILATAFMLDIPYMTADDDFKEVTYGEVIFHER